MSPSRNATGAIFSSACAASGGLKARGVLLGLLPQRRHQLQAAADAEPVGMQQRGGEGRQAVSAANVQEDLVQTYLGGIQQLGDGGHVELAVDQLLGGGVQMLAGGVRALAGPCSALVERGSGSDDLVQGGLHGGDGGWGGGTPVA